ncbi:MAG: hypothetical protein J1D88_03685 [Treponema sp.]|nr:hypothetical protein [Treponema sp.]
MKGVKKYLFLMAVVAALFGFVACSNDDDGASKVAVYASDEETLTFYDDGTFKVVEDGITVSTGTYTGDVTKNTGVSNEVTATIKKWRNEDGKLVNIKDYVKAQVKKGLGSKADSVSEEYIDYLIETELKALIDMPVTIQDGELTIHGLEETYTKKN